ncbi:hypothetical protein M409DRAFT_26901 [Zasmidium cellare ATCC 36951]|uniref:Uncharacterized protein n=1 Tax=Zasmidium cellare ATCC 36951 TaxID=1080233 RepID=A0A6A6C750_ZASCE|nr:uncharacterized protein M409DRAFT_26901 [Zasmidium cellare ATCC 36951]KAF2162663.1 hypothetical protein M409DRAFT_26901 [Zasmidium cellare ATCC 36951]
MLTQSLLITGLAALVAADKQNNPGYYNQGNQGSWPQNFGGNQRFPQQGGGDPRLLQSGGNWPQGGSGQFGQDPRLLQGGGGWPSQGNGIPTNQQQQQQQQNNPGVGGGFLPPTPNNQQQQQQQQQQNSGGDQQQQQQQQITLNVNTAPTANDPHYQKPDIHLNRLTPYSTECTQIGFDPDIDVTIINIDIQQIQCQAFGDPQGQQPVGGIFGYDNPCDLGEEPVQVESILCSVHDGDGCGDGCH